MRIILAPAYDGGQRRGVQCDIVEVVLCELSWPPRGGPLHFTLGTAQNVVTPLAGVRCIGFPGIL